MQRNSFYFIVVFSIFCVVLFGGQRTRSIPPQKLQPKEPVRDLVSEKPAIPLLFFCPDDIRWQPQQQGSTAPRTVTLLGDPKAEGLYVTRTIIPKGKQIIPHRHTDSRTVVVLSGTYYYGIGEEFDAQKLVALPPGSFLTEPAGVPHFTWAKDEDVIVQTTAVGPSGTQLVPDKPSQNRP
ncbi:MAG: cupin domain-containing protein [Planctomycetaceae bacterium]|jgi:quercetin dioxygenase-like cupin family protein|nr:cupin domain-containing protein [Planctomycetaceae bacterium]